MTSWVRTITSPFRKACTLFNQEPSTSSRDIIQHKNSQQQGHHHHEEEEEEEEEEECRVQDLHGEVMACGYEDVQVMWSILDKSPKAQNNMITQPPPPPAAAAADHHQFLRHSRVR